MIAAGDVLRYLQSWATDADVEEYQPLVNGLLADAAEHRFYVPTSPGQRLSEFESDAGLQVHSCFILKVLRRRPMRTQGIVLRFVGGLTDHDCRQLLTMFNRFLDTDRPSPQLVDLDRLPLPSGTAAVLMTGFRQGSFIPVVWVNRELSLEQGTYYLDQAISSFMAEVTSRLRRSAL